MTTTAEGGTDPVKTRARKIEAELSAKTNGRPLQSIRPCELTSSVLKSMALVEATFPIKSSEEATFLHQHLHRVLDLIEKVAHHHHERLVDVVPDLPRLEDQLAYLKLPVRKQKPVPQALVVVDDRPAPQFAVIEPKIDFAALITAALVAASLLLTLHASTANKAVKSWMATLI